jgi:hypothetical protein
MACLPVIRAQDTASVSTTFWDISDLLDRLPDMSAFGSAGPTDSLPVRYYIRPHLGDFIHRAYLRLPVGARVKVSEHFELHTELESYFTHGLRGSAGNGLSQLQVGGKYEKVTTPLHPLGWSAGLDLQTPLSRPPIELVDGYRHVLPYVAFSEPLVPSCNLVGYASLGADFISHTALPSNFGENQLHTNALTFSVGATRDFKRFKLALTGTWNTSLLLSNENHNVFALRPDILIPVYGKRYRADHAHLLLILGGRAVDGPDGTDFGLNGSLRIEFAVQPGRTAH